MKTHIITVLRAQALKSESMRRNPAFFHFLTVDPWTVSLSSNLENMSKVRVMWALNKIKNITLLA